MRTRRLHKRYVDLALRSSIGSNWNQATSKVSILLMGGFTKSIKIQNYIKKNNSEVKTKTELSGRAESTFKGAMLAYDTIRGVLQNSD